jgi:hypothetical protein
VKRAYLVTSGTYSDYHVHQIFSHKRAAERFRDKINGGTYSSGARVETFRVRDQEWVPTTWLGRTSIVSTETGDVLETADRTGLDKDGDYTGKSTTTTRRLIRKVEVYTHGDATRVPQAHSDAVAKLRAEVLGL